MAFFQALGASLGGRVADQVFPADSKESGGSLGQGAKDYYDAAFPGTNPWERLGAGNPQGQVDVAHQQAKQKNKELHTASQTQLKTAQIHANAQVKSAQISANPGERQAAVAEALSGPQIAKLAQEAKTLDTQAVKNLQDALLSGAKTEWTQADLERVLASTQLIGVELLDLSAAYLNKIREGANLEALGAKYRAEARIRHKDATYYEVTAAWNALNDIFHVGTAILGGRWIGNKIGDFKKGATTVTTPDPLTGGSSTTVRPGL